jgi:glycosyltransferase involved in cell wall biosynthesis
MSKIKVLVLPSDRSGVSKYRSTDPHIILQNLYPDDFHVDIDYEPPIDDLNYFKQYQIVHFHRSIGRDYDRSPSIIEAINKLGVITVGDIDDYWLPTKEHPLHSVIVQNKINEKIINSLKAATYVTTTTELFADEIRKFHKNVIVFPNAINTKEEQFKGITEKSDRLRIGWLGGSSHLHDLKLLDGTFNALYGDKDKMKIVMCGFDTRGEITEINKQTGKQTKRPIKPHETVWVKYEEIFTDKYRWVSSDYKKELDKFTEIDLSRFGNESYERVWTRPITSYAKNYTKFDVSLAPIKNHMFNRMKSQLKVIEAGFYKKALIASDVGPYTIDLKHALDNGKFTDGNALLVNENRNHGDWSKFITKLIKNPNWVVDLGERLYETVKDKYELSIVTKDRAEFYKTIIK